MSEGWKLTGTDENGKLGKMLSSAAPKNATVNREESMIKDGIGTYW